MRGLEEAVRQVRRHLRAAVARPRLVARAEVVLAPLPEWRDRPEALRPWDLERILDRCKDRVDLRRAQGRAEAAPVGVQDAGTKRVRRSAGFDAAAGAMCQRLRGSRQSSGAPSRATIKRSKPGDGKRNLNSTTRPPSKKNDTLWSCVDAGKVEDVEWESFDFAL